MPYTITTARSRFALILWCYLFFVSAASLLRGTLLLHQGTDIPVSISLFAGIFGIGLLYDTVFFSFCATPVVLLLLSTPERIYRHRFFQFFLQFATTLFIYASLFAAVAEWFFWEEFGTRFNFIAVDYLIYRREVSQNIRESYPLFTILTILAGLTILLFFALRRFIRSPGTTYEPFRTRLRWALPLLLVALGGGLFLNQSQHQFSTNAYANELAASGPYQFVAAFRNNQLDYRTFYRTGNDRELSAHLAGMLQPVASATSSQPFDIVRNVQGRGPEQRLNVVMITVESLSADFLGPFGSAKGLTPFLDRLAGESLFFTNLYATGTRTVRGLEALTLSIPPTPGHAVLKRPDNAGMFTLGTVFDQHGYDSAFLYGGHGYFDNMNAFFAGNGFRVVDRSDFTADEVSFENAWGVADGDLYRKVLNEASRDAAAQQPFFFEIMTTSNHRPYTYPAGEVAIPSGSGRDGAVQYTDHALAAFFNTARQQPWFDDTLFVIVADHCAGSAGKEELPVGQYHIPLFIYAPKYMAPKRVDTLASQIDVAPTILGLLNFDYRSLFFGQDLFAAGVHPRALIGNYQRLGLFENDQLAYLSPGQQLVVVEQPLGRATPEEKSTAEQQPIVADLIAYYQGADYLLAHRLNRSQVPIQSVTAAIVR